MSKVFRIVGITGSLRKDSWNTKLLRAYEQACKDEEFTSQGVQFEFADWSKYPLPLSPLAQEIVDDRLPVYNGDLEANVPQAVLDFKKHVASADGIIICTPEYNYSVPGALKNAIDWASRPTYGGPNAWKGKVVGIAGVGPQAYEGAHGGLLAALALRQSTMFLEWRIVDSPKVHLLKAAEKFNASGELKAEEEHVWKSVKGMLREVIQIAKQSKRDATL